MNTITVKISGGSTVNVSGPAATAVIEALSSYVDADDLNDPNADIDVKDMTGPRYTLEFNNALALRWIENAIETRREAWIANKKVPVYSRCADEMVRGFTRLRNDISSQMVKQGIETYFLPVEIKEGE